MPPGKDLSTEALVLLHTGGAEAGTPVVATPLLSDRHAIIRAADDQGRPLEYTVRLSEQLGRLPSLEVTRAGKLLETLELVDARPVDPLRRGPAGAADRAASSRPGQGGE